MPVDHVRRGAEFDAARFELVVRCAYIVDTYGSTFDTVHVSGIAGATGIAIAEVYEVP